jgi:Ca-activated chloride channel family protein
MVTALLTALACVLMGLGELVHVHRLRRIARLAFGPSARPAAWARAVPWLRVAAAGAVAWGALTLMTIPPRVHAADRVDDQDFRHLLLVLDVSPSMRLMDAGPEASQSRRHRARDVLESLFRRVAIGRYRISIVAVYNGAKPVVIDTRDAEVVRNILADLPMEYAFTAGKTRLFDGLDEAARIAKPWPAKSTLLVLVSDGDTVPATGMPALPPSIGDVLVVGVGDPLAGRFIDGRQSRQDSSTLRQIAVRLGGHFHDCNATHLPTDTIRAVSEGAQKPLIERLTAREYALLAITAGSAWLALVPLLLHLLGTSWRPGVPLARRGDRVSGRTLSPAAAAIR